MKFDQVKATTPTRACQHDNVIVLPATRHAPRQLMVIDDKDETLYNAEFPSYLSRGGFFSGRPNWAKILQDIVVEHQNKGKTVAEVYFCGAAVEYDLIKKTVDKLNVSHFKAHPLKCFYVRPDIEDMIADARLHNCAELLGIADDEELNALIAEEADDGVVGEEGVSLQMGSGNATNTTAAAIPEPAVEVQPPAETTTPTPTNDDDDPFKALDALSQEFGGDREEE